MPIELPAALLASALPSLGARLRAAAALPEGPAAGGALDVAAGEALWGAAGPAELEDRTGVLVRELADLANCPAASARHSALHALLGLALSRSPGAACVQEVAKDRPCVLILGHAGGQLEDLRPQLEFYWSRGFGTISMIPCFFPRALRRDQEARLSRELHTALGSSCGDGHGIACEGAPGKGVLLHLCGPLTAAWLLPLWRSSAAAFDGLPAPEDCVSAFIWESGPLLDASAAARVASLLSAEAARRRAGAEAGAARSSNARLSLEQMLKMQRDLQARFSSDAFQDRLDDLEQAHERGSARFLAERNALFLEAQIPVLKKYGFEPSQKGVLDMLKAGAQWSSNPDFCRMRDRLNDLLGLSFEGSAESARRLEAARRELTEALQGRRQQDKLAGRGSGDTGANCSEGREDGYARLAARCLRSLLTRYAPEVDIESFMQEHCDSRLLQDELHSLLDSFEGEGIDTDCHHDAATAGAAAVAALASRASGLLLCSEQDEVVPLGDVERFSALVRAHCRGAGEVVVDGTVAAAHGRLWQTDRDACARAATRLLRRGASAAEGPVGCRGPER